MSLSLHEASMASAMHFDLPRRSVGSMWSLDPSDPSRPFFPLTTPRLGTGVGTAFLELPRSKRLLRQGLSFLDPSTGDDEVSAPSDKPPEAKAEARHFVVCKKPLPLGEPRACEMEGYEACEDKCKEHFAGEKTCYETCISHCVIGRNKQKEMRVEPNCYAEKVAPGDLAKPQANEPEVYDEVYREADYQW